MRTTRWGGVGWKVPGRWLSPTSLTVLAMVALAVGRRSLTGWAPLEGMLELSPDGELALDVLQTVLWLTYRGLRKLGLPDLGIGRGCTPEA